MQQSICVDGARNWSVSVAWGFSVRWYPLPVRPLELEAARRTFLSWTRQRDPEVFDFDTRAGALLWSHAPSVFQVLKRMRFFRVCFGSRDYLRFLFA